MTLTHGNVPVSRAGVRDHLYREYSARKRAVVFVPEQRILLDALDHADLQYMPLYELRDVLEKVVGEFARRGFALRVQAEKEEK